MRNLQVAYSMATKWLHDTAKEATVPLIPTVVEADGRAERAFDIYRASCATGSCSSGRPVDEEIANLIVAQLLFLAAEDPDADVNLYVNSPGGEAYAGMAIYDAMQHIRPAVKTICYGIGMSAAAMIVAGRARQALGPAARKADDPPGLRRLSRRAERLDRGARDRVDDAADGGDPLAPLGRPVEQRDGRHRP